SSHPTLAAIAGQASAAYPASLSILLQGSDVDGDPLTYSAAAVSQPYLLNQAYGFYPDAGGSYINYRGQQERYLRGHVSSHGYALSGDTWYYLMPNGDLYEFTPPYGQALTGAFVASLGS